MTPTQTPYVERRPSRSRYITVRGLRHHVLELERRRHVHPAMRISSGGRCGVGERSVAPFEHVVAQAAHGDVAAAARAALDVGGSAWGSCRVTVRGQCENHRMSSPTPFVLRAAVLGDVASIVQLIHGLAEFEKLTDLVKVTPRNCARTCSASGRWPRPGWLKLRARVAKRWVAFALFFTNFSTFLAQPGLYLEDLFVKPEHRGAGIGEALLKRLAQLAVERGCGRFEWSVLDWNENAIRFYERMGASVMPDWRICRVTGDALQQLGAELP